MGSTSSRITERFTSRFSKSSTSEQPVDGDDSNIVRKGHFLVRTRKGSMFRDEDGHVAHEFYVEVSAKDGTAKSSMKRVTTNLTPQGDVPYRNARLHGDFPYIIASR